MNSSLRFSTGVLLWLGVLLTSPSFHPLHAQEEMDFGGDEAEGAPADEGVVDEGVVDEGVEAAPSEAAPSEEEPEPETPAYVFAFSASPDDRPIVNELGGALRDVLDAHTRYSITAAERLLNGFGPEAEEALEQAAQLYQAGQDAATNLEMEAAVEHFSQALDAYEEQIAHIDDLNVITDCLISLGATLVLAGNSRAAATNFQRVLLVDPERRPDPDIYPPPVISAFDRAAARVARVRNGRLLVESDTPGAQVFVDGVYQGPAPQELTNLKAGRHYVRVRSEGYVEQGRVVELSSRRPVRVRFDLEPTENGPAIEQMLGDLATALSEENTDGAVEVVRQLGEMLGVELLATAYVHQEDDGVHVRLDGWDVAGGESVSTENLGPFENDGVLVAGEVSPSFDEMLSRVWAIMHVPQVEDEPVVESRPPPPPPPPPPRPVWQRWWFWTIVGVAVVGAGVGIGLGVGLHEGPPGETQGQVILDL